MNISLIFVFLFILCVAVRMVYFTLFVLFFCLLFKNLHIIINLLILINLRDIYTT